MDTHRNEMSVDINKIGFTIRPSRDRLIDYQAHVGVLKSRHRQILFDTPSTFTPPTYIAHKWFPPVFLVFLASVSLFVAVRPCLNRQRVLGSRCQP